MANEILAAQNVRLTTTTTTDSNGKAVPALKVTFNVGRHGPFTELFPKGKDDVATVRSWIDSQVQRVNQIVGASS